MNFQKQRKNLIIKRRCKMDISFQFICSSCTLRFHRSNMFACGWVARHVYKGMEMTSFYVLFWFCMQKRFKLIKSMRLGVNKLTRRSTCLKLLNMIFFPIIFFCWYPLFRHIEDFRALRNNSHYALLLLRDSENGL